MGASTRRLADTLLLMTAAPTQRPFLCYAVKAGGGRSLVVRAASGPGQLAGVLRKERLTVLRAYPLPRVFTPETKLALKDQAILNEQLHALLSRGVPLVEALEVVAGTVTSVARPVVSTIREQVANGMSFAEACAKSGVLDQVTVAIYRAAERSGDLAGAAKQLATSQRRTLLVSGRAQSLLIYPFVLMIVTTFVALVLLIGVLPTIGTRLMDMAEGVALPIYSRVLIGVGLFLREHIVIFLGLFAAVVVALVLARQQVRVWVLGIGRRLPIIRDVTLAAESARFFTVMSAMSKSGVPLAEGLVTANQVVSHPLLRKQLENLRAKLVAGGLLRQLIENVTAMPLATRRLLLAAERAGDLDNAFLTLAMDMTEEVEKGSARLLAFLQPALIVILSGVVGTLLMAILVPILTISSRIGGGG